jgi:hypothetical protein
LSFFRSPTTRVMSTSTICVTCACVSSDSRMCFAITLRIVEKRYTSSSGPVGTIGGSATRAGACPGAA